MNQKTKTTLLGIVGLGLVIIFFLIVYLLLRSIWHQFIKLDTNLAVGLLTAVTTVLVTTLTIVVGRYLERKKEVEAHYREKKTEIYDSFLREFFKLSHNPSDEGGDLVSFLRDWQRQMILWGGADVLVSFMKWQQHLAKGEPDAQSIFMTDEFFRSLRHDLGLSNRGLEKGAFVKFIIRHADLFFTMAKENPQITLRELAQKEKELGLE